MKIIIVLLLCHQVFCYDYIPKGDPCRKSNGANGTCVNMYNCPDMIFDRKNDITICSFEDMVPNVCCSSCELTEDIRAAVVTVTGQLYYKTGSKAWDNCLTYSSTLPYHCEKSHYFLYNTLASCFAVSPITFQFAGFASGGRNAARREMPHMALLGYGDQLKDVEWHCGGTIISENFVLTAGHCINFSLGNVSYVGVGILKRSDDKEYWQIRRVKNFLTHPGYQPPSKYHDIALLKVNKPFIFTKDVLPACLHYIPLVDKRNGRNTVNYRTTAAGWGRLGHKQIEADVLQVVNLNELTPQQCSAMYPVHRHLARGIDHNTQMCYANFGRSGPISDTCEGDSGGPLQYFDESICSYVIIGVTSYGRPCGFRGGAGVYTRVLSYVPWIESVVWS